MTVLLIDRLRRDFEAAGFGVDELNELWGDVAAAALARGNRVPAQRVLDTREPSPLATLARLFILGLPSSVDDTNDAFPNLGVTGAAALGLVAFETDDDDPTNLVSPAAEVRALSDLRPYSFTDERGSASWWIASDLGELATGEPLREDHVLGVGGASLTLSAFALQTSVDSVFDLGTGCGIQAMHAARFARRVVATDVSERALHYAQFNARLNRIDSIEFRLGSLFEPVVGERFDRIVSNPPFVITPRMPGVPEYEYRDGGMPGDDLVAAVVRGSIDHLTPGGVAQFLGNWESRVDVRGLDRVRGWIDPLGVDAWVIERESQDVAQYSETWIRDGGTRPGTPEFETLAAAWLEDFASRGVTDIGFGYLLLRRPAVGTPTLARFESCAGATGDGSLAAHIAAVLVAHDQLADLDDDAFLDLRLTVPTDITEERHYWPGDDDPTIMLLRQGGGFSRVVSADTALAAVVGASDGHLSIRAICAALGDLLEVDEQALATGLSPKLRDLLETGILEFGDIRRSLQ